jgi:hypothetical protein
MLNDLWNKSKFKSKKKGIGEGVVFAFLLLAFLRK